MFGAMAEAVSLLVGTKRGLFVLRSDPGRRDWEVSEPKLVGREVYHAFLDPRDGRTAWAATDHAVWGAHVHRSDDLGQTWEVLEAAPHHPDERGLKAIWFLAPGPARLPDTLWAGIQPAGLFRSGDGGRGWEPVSSLNDHPTNVTWQAAGGGLALHSIFLDPRTPERVYCALSAGGVYRSDDGGATWHECPGLTSLPSSDLWSYPPRPETHHVRCITPDPRASGRLYVCIEAGALVRSDDGGDSWQDRTPDGPRDTHTRAVHRRARRFLGAAAGDGYAESRDGGETWRWPDSGLEHSYLWGVALDARDPYLRIVSAAAGPRQAHDPASAESYIYRRVKRGRFVPVTAGLPPPRRTTVASLVAHPRESGVFFAANNQGLFGSVDGGQNWEALDIPWPDHYRDQRINGLVAAAE
jgi:photosystem II stability/assembly factor-like uncharacterized protein